MRRTTAIAAALLFAVWANASAAQTCEVARPMDGQRLLRRLSIDLRGRVPSFEEQALQSGKADVSEATIDAFLASPELTRAMRRYHSELLWPNLNSADIDPLQQKLFPIQVGPNATDVVYFSVLRALLLRSVTQPFPPCRNEPVQYEADGSIKMFPLYQNGQLVAYQEGYVEVSPYWAPNTTIRVCALDAQTASSAPMCTPAARSRSAYLEQYCDSIDGFARALGFTIENAPTSCDGPFAMFAPGCGCGPDLRVCSTNQTAELVRRSLVEQQMRLIDQVIAEGRPYTEILLTRRIEVNGYLAHWLRYQSRASFDLFFEDDPTSPIPALTWQDGDRWVEVVRTGRHSGVLTTPGYLLKFASNRGRAHRYYNAFECSSFLPNGPLPSPQESCSKHENLTLRCGCDACHVKLEPMAAAFGRFSEYGMAHLDDIKYPKTASSVCGQIRSVEQLFRCFRFYELDPVGEEVPYRGMLNPYVFRTDEEAKAVDKGPAALAEDSIASGRFATCTVRKLWTHLMRRPPTAEEEATVLPDLRRRFEADSYRLKGLIKAIVTHPAYRRLP